MPVQKKQHIPVTKQRKSQVLQALLNKSVWRFIFYQTDYQWLYLLFIVTSATVKSVPRFLQISGHVLGETG